MNDAILTQLKILVERAVRSVRASAGRKRKMREELLAHVTAVFKEEAKLGEAALERVAARFGDPAELARQLQESVPAGDCIAWFGESLIGFPARESTLRRAARHAFVVGGLASVFLTITILMGSNRSEWLTTARVPSFFASVNVAFLTFCGTLNVGAMRQALDGPSGRSWLLAGVVAAGAWLFIPATTFTFCLALSGNVEAALWDVLPTVPLGVLAPVALVLVVHASDAEFRSEQEWASLPIGLEKGEAA